MNVLCQIGIYMGGGELSAADPAGILSGAKWETCNKPAIARGKVNEYLCKEHAEGYPEPEFVNPLDIACK